MGRGALKQALEVLHGALGGGGLEASKVGSGREKPAINAHAVMIIKQAADSSLELLALGCGG
jgi:hypothetical protein